MIEASSENSDGDDKNYGTHTSATQQEFHSSNTVWQIKIFIKQTLTLIKNENNEL
jgi:hypothetical protein